MNVLQAAAVIGGTLECSGPQQPCSRRRPRFGSVPSRIQGSRTSQVAPSSPMIKTRFFVSIGYSSRSAPDRRARSDIAFQMLPVHVAEQVIKLELHLIPPGNVRRAPLLGKLIAPLLHERAKDALGMRDRIGRVVRPEIAAFAAGPVGERQRTL